MRATDTFRSHRDYENFLQLLNYWNVFLLFRKPISSVGLYVNNELIASSNPNSQIDTETHYLLEKVVCEEVSAQEKYLKIDCAIELKEQWQGKVFNSLFSTFLQNSARKLP